MAAVVPQGRISGGATRLLGQVGDTVGWCSARDAGVGSVVVVPVQPVAESGLPLGFGGVGPLVGLLLQQGAAEPFGLAVGLGPPGPGPNGDAHLGAGGAPVVVL